MRALRLEPALIIRHIRQLDLIALGVRVGVGALRDNHLRVFRVARLFQGARLLRFYTVCTLVTEKQIDFKYSRCG